MSTLRVGVNTLFMIPGDVGGSETYLRETLKAMPAVRPESELILFTNAENDATLRADLLDFPGATFVPLGFHACNRFARILREQLQLPPIARKSGIDVLWSPGYTAPRTSVCPQVVTILDMQYKRHPEDLSLLARWTTDRLVQAACSRCRAVLAISEFARQEVVRYTAAPAERIFVSPLGVDPAYSREPTDIALSDPVRDVLSADMPYILCVANSYPHKNLDVLAEAFAQIRASLPHALVIVGKPRRGEARLAMALARIPAPSRVRRLADLRRDELITLYRGADLFAFPSVYEGFGLPVAEAMMAGVPVITTREASIPEIGGHCVEYAAPTAASFAQGLRAMAAWSPAEREDRITRARARVAAFTWRRTAEATFAALETARARSVRAD